MMENNEIEELSLEEWEKMSEIVDFPGRKREFVEQFEDLIIRWVKQREKDILDIMLDEQKTPIWNNKSYKEVTKERNEKEEEIKESRIKNAGGIDINTAKKVYKWGGMDPVSLCKVSEEEFLQLTRTVFNLADEGKFFEAAYKFMKKMYASGGIAGTTKLIGLSNQDTRCIYDSRVGHYLKDLKKGGAKLILHPPGRRYCPDSNSTTQGSWAKNYERLIWTLEVIQKYLNGQYARLFMNKGFKPRIADIELAFFALGRCP